jgi:hypothetical protein
MKFPELGSSEQSNFKLIHLTRNDTLSGNSNLNYCLLEVTAPKGYGIKVSGLLGQLVFVQMYSEGFRIHFEFNSTITENESFPEKFFGNKVLIVVENNENLAHISNPTLMKTSLTLNTFKCVSIKPQAFNGVNCIDAEDVIELNYESSGDINAYNPETLCEEGLTACANGTCIPINLFCNHNNDCGDNSDETDNMCKSYPKIEPKSEPSSQRTYSSINSGKFISIIYVLQKNLRNLIKEKFKTTLHPVYSELAYSEYPLIMNWCLRTDR